MSTTTQGISDVSRFNLLATHIFNYISTPDIKDHLSQPELTLSFFQVKMISFYDVVIDFILFDAFDDLENPPSSVTTVVQNRWLSNGFKETVSCEVFTSSFLSINI